MFYLNPFSKGAMLEMITFPPLFIKIKWAGKLCGKVAVVVGDYLYWHGKFQQHRGQLCAAEGSKLNKKASLP